MGEPDLARPVPSTSPKALGGGGELEAAPARIAFMTMAGGLTTMEVERDTRLPSTGGGGRYAPRSGTRDPRPRRVGCRDEWRPQPSARLCAPRERHARRRHPGDVYLGSA